MIRLKAPTRSSWFHSGFGLIQKYLGKMSQVYEPSLAHIFFRRMVLKKRYQLIPTGQIGHKWINHPLTGGTNTRWVSQPTFDCHYIEKPPKFYPKRTEKPVCLAVFLKKTRMVGHQFFWKKCGWRLPERLTHLTFGMPEKLQSEKGKEVVHRQTCLKKLQRCMIWISCS